MCAGDAFEIGSARLAATQPRPPALQAGHQVRHDHDHQVAPGVVADRVLHSGLEGGKIQAGDEIKQGTVSPDSETVTEMVRAFKKKQR